MPRNTTLTLPAGAWTQITDADIISATAQNLSEVGGLYLQATVGAVPPAAPSEGDLGGLAGAQFLPERATILNETLADLFPGVAGANRLYAWPEAGDGTVRISHA